MEEERMQGRQPRNGQLTCTDRDGGLHFIAVTINLIPFFKLYKKSAHFFYCPLLSCLPLVV